MSDDTKVENPEDTGKFGQEEEARSVTISFTWRKGLHNLHFFEDDTVEDLFHQIEDTLHVPLDIQKIIVPKGPLLKYPLKTPSQPIKDLEEKKLILMGPPADDILAINDMAARARRRDEARRAQRAKKVEPRMTTSLANGDGQYTFMQVRPLNWLPHPERSQALLMRLKEDRGIREAMRKHKFTVSLLTEMEPLSNTQSSHEGTSRLLGLNRNQGEVIELRLRTDAHDGYRDYKTIRKTLCHELAHNVHGPHDRKFWDLCHQIEREVDHADWASGHSVSGEGYRSSGPSADYEEEDHEDEGGWTGGEFVLGGVRGQSSSHMSRREILAQAAMERVRKEDETEGAAKKGQQKRPTESHGDAN